MPPLSGPVLALMALLALAGIQKIADPKPTSGALQAAGLPGTRQIVIALGIAEIATGLTGIVIGGSTPAFVGFGFYTAFALFVGNALIRKLPIRSCGCLGATETPPSIVHVIVNSAAAGTLFVAVWAPVDMLRDLSSQTIGEAVAFLLFTTALVYLLYGALAVLPLHKKQMSSQTAQVTISAGPAERSR